MVQRRWWQHIRVLGKHQAQAFGAPRPAQAYLALLAAPITHKGLCHAQLYELNVYSTLGFSAACA